MARGVLADPSSCDPKAGEQTGMSQTSPASAWLESKAPASRSLAVQPAVPVGMWGLQKPRPVSLAPRACKGLPGPRGARHPDGQAARPTAGRAAWGMGLRPSSSRRGPWPGCVATTGPHLEFLFWRSGPVTPISMCLPVTLG